MSDIPVVSLRELHSSDPTVQAKVADAIQIAFGTFGLIYIQDHGIDRAEVLQTYDRYRDLLARPVAEKQSWGGESIWYQRGWTPPDTERAVVAGGQPDFKECFFLAPVEIDPRCQAWWPEVYADNVWPERAEHFQAQSMKIGTQLHSVGLALLSGCERALGLPTGELAKRCDGAPHLTRILKYLELKEEQLGEVLWGEEHTDFNLLTLLPGGAFYYHDEPATPAQTGGLSLRTRPSAAHPRGQMVPGRPPPGCMVAQVGQQLEVLTAGAFLATPHVISAPNTTGWTRCSMAHFIHLHGTELVAPLEAFQNTPEATHYAPPVLAGTYAHKTLVDIGLAPAESLSKLGYRQYGRLSRFRAIEDNRNATE